MSCLTCFTQLVDELCPQRCEFLTQLQRDELRFVLLAPRMQPRRPYVRKVMA